MDGPLRFNMGDPLPIPPQEIFATSLCEEPLIC